MALTEHPTAETHPFRVVLVELGHGTDLQGVLIAGRVLEEAIIRIEELPGHEQEELPRRPAIVEAFLAGERDEQLVTLQIFLRNLIHELLERIRKKIVARDGHFGLRRARGVPFGIEFFVESAQFLLEARPT